MNFEWDPKKNLLNQKKHGISFEEASTVFFDENAILFDDPEHSDSEERFLLLGVSSKASVCIICHCYRENGMTVRIISARRATKKRRRDMRKEYDIDKLNPRPNPYAKELKRQVTMNINGETVDYFKQLSAEMGIPYQTLINYYLTDCAVNKKVLKMSWE